MPHPRNFPHLRTAALPWLGGLLVVSLALRVLLPASVLEIAYSRGLFPLFRSVWDHSIGLVPVPVFYLFWAGIIGLIVLEMRRFRRISSAATEKRKRRAALAVGLHLLAYLITLVIAFLWLWGYNYGRQPVEERLAFELYEPPLPELRERVFRMGDRLAHLRAAVTHDTVAISIDRFPTDLEVSVRPLVAAALERHRYPAPGAPRAWELLPNGILLRLSTAGVYWPWAGQGNIDAGLHPLQKPAVMAHELAHAYGFGDEGTCSFWGYLAADESDDPLLRYALELAYWRHIAGLLRYADPEGYLEWRESRLAPGIRNDLEAIYANGEQYRDIAPVLRDATYTAYLKAQGIEEGLLNYGRVVRMVEGYRRAFTPPGE
ncbi:uncharacterized protein DUF3810 [Neolewinella xylanilytica]|uniref:Uncharacterized protein DUF3810 n=1 Tax=Neolewinella xylanilytica TaxID=1514080 RepID=A0A2S6I5R1_9BACT|nr:DUF3810 domain-containing protein [Neolewinella xylanilytica]PPK86493.1 uncharacterized protein DUF3810 [Neolewinella xylanilytica]